MLQPCVVCYSPCSYGNVSLQQQCSSLGFLFEQALKSLGKKSPHSATQGSAWGWGRAAMPPLPHCCGASPTPSPNRGFLCWLVGRLGHTAGLNSASLDTI